MSKKKTTPHVCSGNKPVVNDGRYEPFLKSIRNNFAEATLGAPPLFTTSTKGLFSAFLKGLPVTERKEHDCHACRRFVEQYGGLVTIDERGCQFPVLWNAPVDVGGIYTAAFTKVRKLVAKREVVGVFLTSEKVWGQSETNGWHHMAVTPNPDLLYKGNTIIKTASQAMAEKREEHDMLQRGLREFNAKIVSEALRILNAEVLYRSEKTLGPAEWLADLHKKLVNIENIKDRDNIIWKAVATAPAGFCHVRSTMIGTLLEDLQSGLDFETIKRRFSDKMNPLQYQRPQVPPAAGNLARAEKVVAAMKSAGSLARRFARLDDLCPLWTPRTPAKNPVPAGGVFSHLTPKDTSAPKGGGLDLPATAITWEKFQRTVLEDAIKIEYMVPSGHAPFLALCAAKNPDAPPIFQWDFPERRNTVSWYVYSGMGWGEHKTARDWNLSPYMYVPVRAVTYLPFMWDQTKTLAHQGAGVVFVLEGCKDLHHSGTAIFPECLKAEYHEIRASIEAYSRADRLEEVEEPACGVDVRKGRGGTWGFQFRVTGRDGNQRVYVIDRWD